MLLISIKIKEVFEEMRKIPNGVFIDRPDDLVMGDIAVSKEIKEITRSTSSSAHFKRRSLKHLAEKGDEGERLLNMIPSILGCPEEIRQGRLEGRFLISKSFKIIGAGRPHNVIIEVAEKYGNIIVTSFQTDTEYLSNYKLLWRTGVPKGTVPPSRP